MSIEVRRASLTSDELKRHLLALILAAVLVWYTALAVPSRARTYTTRSLEGDGEVREDGAASAFGEAEAVNANAGAQVEELDWPEYIYPG